MAGNNWNAVELRDNRYNQIVHMVSAANGAEEFYSTEVILIDFDLMIFGNNRLHSRRIMLADPKAYRQPKIWTIDRLLPGWVIPTLMSSIIRLILRRKWIEWLNVFARNWASTRAIVCCVHHVNWNSWVNSKRARDDGTLNEINKHIYFTTTVKCMPDDSEFPDFADFEVVHHYLQSAGPKLQPRLRKRGQNGHWTYIHTIRRPHVNKQSVEVRTQLTHRDYQNLLAQRDDNHITIFKKRRCFLVNNQYFQLDIYKEPTHPR